MSKNNQLKHEKSLHRQFTLNSCSIQIQFVSLRTLNHLSLVWSGSDSLQGMMHPGTIQLEGRGSPNGRGARPKIQNLFNIIYYGKR